MSRLAEPHLYTRRWYAEHLARAVWFNRTIVIAPKTPIEPPKLKSTSRGAPVPTFYFAEVAPRPRARPPVSFAAVFLSRELYRDTLWRLTLAEGEGWTRYLKHERPVVLFESRGGSIQPKSTGEVEGDMIRWLPLAQSTALALIDASFEAGGVTQAGFEGRLPLNGKSRPLGRLTC